MLCLLLLMSLSILIGISFKESTENELDRLRKSMVSGFTLKVNTENELYYGEVDYGNGFSAYDYAGPKITEEIIDKIVSVDGVKDCILNFTDTVWIDLELRPAMWAEPDEEFTEEFLTAYRHKTDIYPCRNGELHKNFRTGALVIKEGRNIEEGDHYKAVISVWLAEKNHLSVGDTFTIEDKEGFYKESDEPMKTLGETIELEIVGLFHANFSQQSSVYTPEHSLIENVIYTDMDVSAKLKENIDRAGYRSPHKNGYITVEFLVQDPGKIDSVMQRIENQEDIDLENLEFEVNNTDYQAAANPYNQIRIFAMILLILGVCGMGSILYLTVKLWMQGRQREIGILYSIGMKKRGILGQMLVECLIMSIVALILAFLLSGSVINQCADVAERLTAPKTDAEEYNVKLDGSFRPIITKIASGEVILECVVSTKTTGYMIFFVCGISCISVLLSFAKISHLEPRKLLQSM